MNKDIRMLSEAYQKMPRDEGASPLAQQLHDITEKEIRFRSTSLYDAQIEVQNLASYTRNLMTGYLEDLDPNEQKQVASIARSVVALAASLLVKKDTKRARRDRPGDYERQY